MTCLLSYWHWSNSERNLAALWRWHCFAETCRSHRVNKAAYILVQLLVNLYIMPLSLADKHPLLTMLWTTYPITYCILNTLQNNKYVLLDNLSTNTHLYPLARSCSSSLALGDQVQMGLHRGQCSLAERCLVYKSEFVLVLPLQPVKQPKPQIQHNLTYFFGNLILHTVLDCN
jgi:hypothetical protein